MLFSKKNCLRAIVSIWSRNAFWAALTGGLLLETRRYQRQHIKDVGRGRRPSVAAGCLGRLVTQILFRQVEALRCTFCWVRILIQAKARGIMIEIVQKPTQYQYVPEPPIAVHRRLFLVFHAGIVHKGA